MAKSEDSNGANRSNGGAASALDRAGRYEYVERMAGGSFGSVWKARVTSGAEVGRIVAIRRISRQGLNEAQVERLTSAGFSAMEVRHPKIAAVLDVVVGESEIAVVSEFVEGMRLRDLLHSTSGKGSNCPPEVALKMGLDLLEAVRGARSEWEEIFPEDGSEEEQLLRRCVYGGLLPDTVLVATFGETMITDLGLTGTAMTLPLLSERPEVVAYCAPERHAGLTDERSDVFTVGVFIYELITNKPLFAPANLVKIVSLPGPADPAQLAALRKKVATAPIPRLDSLSRWKGTAFKALADVLARALERDPKKRFQNLDEMIGAILKLGSRLGNEQAVAGFLARLEPITSAKPEPPGRVSVDSVRDTIPPESTSPTIPPLDGPAGSNRPTLPGDASKSRTPPHREPMPSRPPVPGVPPPPVSLRALVDEPITVPALVTPVAASRSESELTDNLPTQPRGFPLPPPPVPPAARHAPPPAPSNRISPIPMAASDKTDLTSSESVSVPLPQGKSISPKIWIAALAAVVLVAIGVIVTRRGGEDGEKAPSGADRPAAKVPSPREQRQEPAPAVAVASAAPAAQTAHADAGERAAASAEPSATPAGAADQPRQEAAPAAAPTSEQTTSAPKRRTSKRPFRPTGI